MWGLTLRHRCEAIPVGESRANRKLTDYRNFWRGSVSECRLLGSRRHQVKHYSGSASDAGHFRSDFRAWFQSLRITLSLGRERGHGGSRSGLAGPRIEHRTEMHPTWDPQEER